MITLLKTYLLVYFEFFKVGLFSIGGGLATIPFLQEIARRYPWFSESMLSDMIAISESTPGAIGVNMATYSGFMAGNSAGGLFGGIIGAVISTIGLTTPAIIIITLVSKAYRRFKENPLVVRSFYAIRPAVMGMICSVGITLIAAALLKDGYILSRFWQFIKPKSLALFVVLLALMNIKPLKKLHPICFILFAGLMGILFAM